MVVDGVMYVTNGNECYALDAGRGRRIWKYQRPRTKGLAGDAASGINRGVAVAGGRVFMVTDDAHLLALDRFTGELVWERRWPTSSRTTAPRPPRSSSATWSCRGSPAETKASAGSSPRSTGDRQGNVAVLDGAAARRARRRDLARHGVAHGCAATWLTGT